jgi:sterol desaturase/sphingolipid hydroxylase (fatty acid hydroxylase superfamily)
MSHWQIEGGKEPIRLFHSGVLEFFTHIHPAVVLVIWAPVTILLLVLAISSWPTDVPLWQIPLAFVIGLFVWTLAEYVLHRFVFHFAPSTPWQKRASFLFHGVHHAQPRCKTRLVMPPAVSIPLALVFYGLFSLLLSTILGARHWVAPVFSGFIAGYLTYDMLHYGTHHFRLRWRAWQFLRQHHMRHHSLTPDMRYGVSSPLWDIVFGTMPSQHTVQSKET